MVSVSILQLTVVTPREEMLAAVRLFVANAVLRRRACHGQVFIGRRQATKQPVLEHQYASI